MVKLPALTGVVGLHFTVNLNRVGEQNRVAVGGVHAIFADGEGASRYGIAADGAIVGHINLAGGQDSLVGITKLQPEQVMPFGLAITIRFLTVDFDKALQATGVLRSPRSKSPKRCRRSDYCCGRYCQMCCG